MKVLISIFVVFVVFSSCRKNDVRHFPGIGAKCDVAAYSNMTYMGLQFANNLQKTYYEPNGPIKTVTQVITQIFADVDSVYYFLNYQHDNKHIIVTVNCLKKHFYLRYPDNMPIPMPGREDEHYTITATLDKQRGRLIEISGTGNESPYPSSQPGTFIMQYSGERLTRFGQFELEYDSAGNIRRVPKGIGSASSILYAYDYKRTAKSQFYFSSGYFVHEYYNLAEVCGWIPVQPKHVRFYQTYYWGTYAAGDSYFRNHVIDSKGFLLSYEEGISGATIINSWRCRSYTPQDPKSD